MEKLLPRTNRKVSAEWRVLAGLAGGTLLGFGISRRARRSRLRGVLGLAGADLLAFAATGHHLHEALGVTSRTVDDGNASRIPHQMGIKVQRSVHVNIPPRKAYDFVRDLENLPRFLQHVKNVSELDEKRSHWVVKAPAGTEVEWDAEIINDLPGELIAWRSINHPDVESAGSIHFRRGRHDTTKVVVKMQYLPPAGALGAVVAKLFGEEPDRQLKDDLGRLKLALESRA